MESDTCLPSLVANLNVVDGREFLSVACLFENLQVSY